jgi:uncharacterized protein YdaU (DUF1376 family)
VGAFWLRDIARGERGSCETEIARAREEEGRQAAIEREGGVGRGRKAGRQASRGRERQTDTQTETDERHAHPDPENPPDAAPFTE